MMWIIPVEQEACPRAKSLKGRKGVKCAKHVKNHTRTVEYAFPKLCHLEIWHGLVACCGKKIAKTIDGFVAYFLL